MCSSLRRGTSSPGWDAVQPEVNPLDKEQRNALGVRTAQEQDLQAVRQLGRLSLEEAVELRMQEFLTDCCKDKNGMLCGCGASGEK